MSKRRISILNAAATMIAVIGSFFMVSSSVDTHAKIVAVLLTGGFAVGSYSRSRLG